MLVAVADASPLQYLILLEQIKLLATFGRVVVPQAVVDELQRRRTPDLVRCWIATPPAWVEIAPRIDQVTEDQRLAILGDGEREAIVLAQRAGADILLMDDREGVEEAHRRGLTVIGTLGVLDLA